MKLTVNPRDLTAAVTVAGRALPGRPPTPVMAALKLHATTDAVGVTGYNYDTSAYATAPARVTDPGTVLVSGRLLTDITRTLRHDVDITATDTTVTLEAGRSRFTLPTLPLEEYPTLPELPVTSGTLPGSEFAAAVAQVATATTTDDTLPVLTGVQLDIQGGNLNLAATDRYRFAVRSLDWEPDECDRSHTFLLPAKALLDSAKALAGGRVFLSLPGTTDSGVTGLSSDTQRITMRGLEGSLPHYDSLFPTEFAATADVDTAALADVVKRVALVADRGTPVCLSFAKGTVKCAAGTSDDAQAVDAADADYTDRTGEFTTFDIAFNPQFLLEGLTAIGDESTRFAFTTPHKPALLRAPSGTEDRLKYLLMPVRLSG